jgi:hypothetical protein
LEQRFSKEVKGAVTAAVQSNAEMGDENERIIY